MPDNDKHSPGDVFQPPAAETWNNMVDAGEEFARRRLGSPTGTKTNQRETDVIKVRNDTGGDRKRGDVVCLDGSPIASGEVTPENIWLKGVEVACDLPFGVYRYDTAANDISKCQTSGVCIARVAVSDISHRSAVIKPGEYVLQSAKFGPVSIVWAPGTGTSDCVVNIHGVQGKAEEILFDYEVDGTNDVVTPTEFYNGPDPELCGSVEVEYPLGEPCNDCEVLAFFDANTGKYQAFATPAAMMGEPSSVTVLKGGQAAAEDPEADPIEKFAFSGCTLEFRTQSIKAVVCKDVEESEETTDIGTTPVAIVQDVYLGSSGIVIRHNVAYVCGFASAHESEIPVYPCPVDPAPDCSGTATWTWRFVGSYYELTTPCAAGCTADPPPYPDYDYRAQPGNEGDTETTPCETPSA